MNSIIFVLFDKYCLIVDQLGAGSAGGKAGWFSADSVL
jgi:hypothetical protein